MGNCCLPAGGGPCDSVEERSSLLQDASKVVVPPAETGVVGTYQNSPDADDDVRKASDEASIKNVEKVVTVQVKQSPQARETESAKTQENGALQKEILPAKAPSPIKGADLKQNSNNTAQDENVKETATDNRPVERPLCTLDSPQSECTTNDQEAIAEANAVPVEELPAAVHDKIQDAVLQPAETVCSEPPSIRADSATDNTTPEPRRDAGDANEEEEGCGSKATTDEAVEVSHCNEVSSLSDSQIPAAACQVSSVSASGQEICTELTPTGSAPQSPSPSSASPSHGVVINKSDAKNGNSSVCQEACPEVIKSHDVSEPSPRSDSTGVNHSGVELNSTSSGQEPTATGPPAARESSKSNHDAEPEPECATISLKEVTSLENLVQEADEEDGGVGEDEEETEMERAPTEAGTKPDEEPEALEQTGEEQLVASTSADVEVEVIPVREQEDFAEESVGNSDEDLYRGAEELSPQRPVPLLEITLPKVEDRCSLAPAVDILSYSEREWKGNTAKSALIRKGYKEMSQKFGSLRRVRGDNYCALRATLFQVLSHSTTLPAWLQQEDITTLPEELEAREGLISQWMFPGECKQGDGPGDATQQLKCYMERLRSRWQAAVGCASAEERQQLCERVFQGREEELGLLEALKLLMLGRAVELHSCMQAGGDVPLFCWLLFARDSSECPRSFLSNHLSHVGLSGGLEQVEMFLLGYALQCTIQVYRLYMADTDEFVTYYPDDHKEDWPSVCLVTEDDRHYNVPVAEAAELPKELTSS